MRLFLAAWANVEHYETIRSDCDGLQGKWVERNNLHLTYRFLGDKFTPEEVIEKLDRLFYVPKILPIKGLGVFNEKILYAKTNDKTLHEINTAITEKLHLEKERFVPHVTLLRIKRIENSKKFKECLSFYHDKTIGTLSTRVLLFSSRLTPKGPIYTQIAKF